MKADFDIAAPDYDKTFTDTLIGKMQRDVVWHYLQKKLPWEKPLKILELNCGTGEDAIFLANMGHEVLATDISSRMLEVCKAKVKKAGLENQITIRQLDMTKLSELVFTEKFDLIFSNFGGLNCLSPQALKKLFAAIQNRLNPGGKLIAVIMPDFCLVESLYFLAKLKFKEIFRRKTKSFLLANVGGVSVKTWYYSPADVKKYLGNDFKEIQFESIGFLPSFMETGIHKNLMFRQTALQTDRFLRWTNYYNATDHFLVEASLNHNLK